MVVKRLKVAVVESLLILPAALFMAALGVRQMTASSFGVAAQRTVIWYAERQWTLWLLLVTLSLVVAGIGCATLPHGWEHERLRSGTATRSPRFRPTA